jgi:hypothetical protein
MKKIKTRLQLTKTTVRVLRTAELSSVQGGIGGGASTNNPTACVADAYVGRGASTNNPTACVAGE